MKIVKKTKTKTNKTIKKRAKVTKKVITSKTKAKTKKPSSYQNDLLARLKDPEYSVEYLKAAMNEDDMPEVFLLALRNVAQAHSMSKLARDSKVGRVNLYKILSQSGNPELHSIYAILKALGLKLSVELKQAS